MDEKGEEIEKYKLEVTSSHRDVKHGIPDRVSNIVITMYGARWVLDLSGKHFVKYTIV